MGGKKHQTKQHKATKLKRPAKLGTPGSSQQTLVDSLRKTIAKSTVNSTNKTPKPKSPPPGDSSAAASSPLVPGAFIPGFNPASTHSSPHESATHPSADNDLDTKPSAVSHTSGNPAPSDAVAEKAASTGYDRIVHAVAGLCMNRMGVPWEAIICMFGTIQQVEHAVRTIYGDSKMRFTGCLWIIPIQGVGQGNGAPPLL